MTQTRRRMDGARRRELIVDAAKSLLTERPYDEVSIGDIAAKAGVTRTVLYDHFPSKKDLVLSFLNDEMSDLLQALANRISTGSGTAHERMIAVLDAHFEFLQARPLAFRILALDSRSDPEIAEAGHRLSQAANQALGAALGANFDYAGIAAGRRLREANLVLLTSAIQGISAWWLEHPEVSRSEIVDITGQWLWRGIRPGHVAGTQPLRSDA